MILYDYFRSSAAYRVRIALNLKGLAAERRFIHLRKAEQRAPSYLEVNPQGFVPTLVVGPARLTQSLAIIEYLEEKHPLPPLLPEAAEDRAWVRAIALAIACDIHPLNNLRILQYLARELQIDEPRRDEWYRHWVKEGFDAIEPQLAARASGRLGLGRACRRRDPGDLRALHHATRPVRSRARHARGVAVRGRAQPGAQGRGRTRGRDRSGRSRRRRRAARGAHRARHAAREDPAR